MAGTYARNLMKIPPALRQRAGTTGLRAPRRRGTPATIQGSQYSTGTSTEATQEEALDVLDPPESSLPRTQVISQHSHTQPSRYETEQASDSRPPQPWSAAGFFQPTHQPFWSGKKSSNTHPFAFDKGPDSSTVPPALQGPNMQQARLLWEKTGLSKFENLRAISDITPEALLEIAALCWNRYAPEGKILKVAEGYRLPPHEILYHMGKTMPISKRLGVIRDRILRIAMNRGEEGGMVDAAFQILRYKAWNFDDVAVRTMPLTSYETVNKALARFIERGEDRAYTYLGLSAKQEGDRLWKDGTLTEEKKEHLSRMAIENLQLAAVRRYSLAMTTLGSLFFDGKLVPRDAFLAKLWWEEGFKYGSHSATWLLAYHLGPLGPYRYFPKDHAAARNYVEARVHETAWLAARAAQWFHLRPGMLEVDHIHFWGNSPDPQKAAMYYAWSGRQRISEGKLGWAELLLYDLADLNSGIELLERYRQDIAAGGKELVSDTNEDVDGQRRGFEDVAEGLSPKPDREIWPFSFDQEGKEIWEREIRSSTRLEKIDAALRLMYSRFIPRKHRMERTGLYVLAARLRQEALKGEPALPAPEDILLVHKGASIAQLATRALPDANFGLPAWFPDAPDEASFLL